MRLARKGLFGGLGVLVVLAAGLYSWPIGGERVKAALDAAIGPAAGLHWRPSARAFFTLLPWPTLRIVDAELVDANGRTVLDSPNARIRLWPARLLVGKFAPMSARLTTPTVLIDLDAAGEGAREIVDSPTPPLVRVEMSGGVAKIVSAERGLDTLTENVDGWLEWTDVARPLSFALSGTWRGHHVAVAGEVDAPLKIRQGDATRANLKIATPSADLVFEGAWKSADKAAFDGDLTADIRSPEAIVRWLGFSDAWPLAPNAILVKAKAVAASGSLALNEAKLEIGGQSLEGSLNVSRLGGKISASGTLAADEFDVAALLGPPKPFLGASGRWSREPIIPEPSDALDLDLRVSAAHATWGGHALEAAAAALQQRDGRLTLKMIEATAYGGALSGEASIQRTPDGLETKATASLANADIGALMSDWGAASYSGHGGMEATLRAVGASPAEMAASLGGTATLEVEDGAVAGVNFEEALRRSQRRPVDVARDMAVGQTKFESARARLDITDGQARITKARMEGPGAIIDVRGGIDIVAREWRAKIDAIQAGALGAPSVDAARLTIALFGPWTAPTIVAHKSLD